jgi:serine phosphatase RsbU (regulator of sigma subunit)
LLYTDGVSETPDRFEVEYGEARLQAILRDNQSLPTEPLIRLLLKDVRRFSSGLPMADDLTVMAIEMAGH